MELILSKEELYSLIKEAVREVITEEKFDIFLKNLPDVSDNEMNDIEDLYGNPKENKDIANREKIKI